MSQLPVAYVAEYSRNLYDLASQKVSKLSPCVDQDTMNGEKAFFEQVGSVSAVEKTQRYPDTPLVETPFERRMVVPKQYHIADLVDNLDEVQLMIEPRSPIIRRQVESLNRRKDMLIISALDADALTGHDGTTVVPFPTSQEIPVDLSGANEGLTIDKLIEAKSLFGKNDIDTEDPDNQLFMGTTQAQLDDLLRTTQVTSSDYNTIKALVRGELDTYLGFKFVRTELFDFVQNSSIRKCFAWAKSGVKYASLKNITGDIGLRRDKSIAWQMYAVMAGNALRMEEEKVVRVLCDENPTTP
jgi:hypothetical protein